MYALFIWSETIGYLENWDLRSPSLGTHQNHVWKFSTRSTCLCHTPQEKPKSWRLGTNPRQQCDSVAELVILECWRTLYFYPFKIYFVFCRNFWLHVIYLMWNLCCGWFLFICILYMRKRCICYFIESFQQNFFFSRLLLLFQARISLMDLDHVYRGEKYGC